MPSVTARGSRSREAGGVCDRGDAPVGRREQTSSATKDPGPTGSDGAPLALVDVSAGNLRSVTVSFPTGRLSLVTGPGGSGKTTLLRVLRDETRRRVGLPVPSDAAVATGEVRNLSLALYFDEEFVRARAEQGEKCVADLLGVRAALAALTPDPACDAPAVPDAETLAAAVRRHAALAVCVPAWGDSAALVAAGFTRGVVGGAEVRLDEGRAEFDAAAEGALVVVDRVRTGGRDGEGESAVVRRIEAAWAKAESLGRPVTLLPYPPDGAGVKPPVHEVPGGPEPSVGDPSGGGGAVDEVVPPPPDATVGRLAEVARGGPSARASAFGLGDLALGRPVSSLSTGEAGRLALSSFLDPDVGHAVFLLDSPSQFAAPSGRGPLLETIRRVLEAGATVIVADPEPETFLPIADHEVALGPGAGEAGGRVVYEGRPRLYSSPTAAPAGPTVARAIQAGPGARRGREISVKGTTAAGRPVDVTVREGVVTCVTGPSGSGKTRLLEDLVVPAVRLLAPGPLPDAAGPGRGGPRVPKTVGLVTGPPPAGSVGAVLDLVEPLRRFYSALPAARAEGLGPKAFTRGGPGACRACRGTGVDKGMGIDRGTEVGRAMGVGKGIGVGAGADYGEGGDLGECVECGGSGFSEVVRGVRFRGVSYPDVLADPISTVASLFGAVPGVGPAARAAAGAGLSHVPLSAKTRDLSASERCLVALCAGGRRTPGTWYVLDRPVAGASADAAATIVETLRGRVREGATAVLADWSPRVIEAADDVLEL